MLPAGSPKSFRQFPRHPAIHAVRGACRNRTGVRFWQFWRAGGDESPAIAPEIGFRLASLADGEGCFIISERRATPGRLRHRPNARTVYSCAFLVQLRDDDRPFLERMQREVGLGRIDGGTSAVGNDRPKVRWAIDTRAGCLAVVSIFDAYPLWSKKARDYAVWREAVLFWATAQPRADLSFLSESRNQLRRTREYVPPGAAA